MNKLFSHSGDYEKDAGGDLYIQKSNVPYISLYIICRVDFSSYFNNFAESWVFLIIRLMNYNY